MLTIYLIFWLGGTLHYSGVEGMPTQINRINYGVQLTSYSWMRSSQINYQLRLIMNIPQTVLPAANQTEFCDARNSRCQAMDICDTLLGHRTDLDKLLDPSLIQNQTTKCQNICQMMEFVLKRIENTKTTLSYHFKRLFPSF